MKVLLENILLYLTLCLLVFTEIATADTSNEICPYSETVDLTNHTRFENGSYLYHDIIVPQEKVAEYDYRLMFKYRREAAEPHVRGCVCNSPKYCIKLCCERDQYYNELNDQCEKLPSDVEKSSEMNIRLDNGDLKTMNIFDYFEYQVGIMCEKPESLSTKQDVFELKHNGILYSYNGETSLDTVSYCLTPYLHNGSNTYVLVPMSCPIKEEVAWSLLFNTYAMAISVVFLVPTVLVYLFLKDLRNNMRGKLLICYLTSLIMCYSIISVITISGAIFEFLACSIMGYTCYYFFIAAYMWLSVLCYDIWINFKEHSVEMSARTNRIRFINYSLYAWGTSGILTALTMWAQWSDTVPELYKPGVGTDFCWLNTNKWSAAIYFYWPNSIILIFNMVTFGHLTLRIYRVRRDLAKMTQRERSFHENALVILRLFLIMGISWIMDIISYCLRSYEDYKFLFILTDFCNAIQGVLIFVLFVCKRNVLDAIKKRFNPDKTRKPQRGVTSLSTQFSKLSTNSSSNVNSA